MARRPPFRPISDRELEDPVSIYALYLEVCDRGFTEPGETERFCALVALAFRLAPKTPGFTLGRLLRFQSWGLLTLADRNRGRSRALNHCADKAGDFSFEPNEADHRVAALLRRRGLDHLVYFESW